MLSTTSRFCARAGLAALCVSLAAGLFAVTPPTPLNTNYAADSGDDQRPSVSAAGAGAWVSVWETTASLGEASGGDWDIAFARSADNGKSWSAPQPVASDAFSDSEDDTNARVAQGTTGTLVCVWQSSVAGGEHDIRFARSTDGGLSWSAPSYLNSDAASDARDDIQPALASDGQGNWMSVWSGGATESDYDLYFSRSTDNGQNWSAPALLDDSAAADDTRNDLEATVCGQSNGTWVVFWASAESSFQPGQARGVFGDPKGEAELRYARSADFGSAWSSPATLQTASSASDGFMNIYSDRAISPELACDAQGTWVVTWTFRRSVQNGMRFRNYVYDVNMSRSTDDGQNWPFSLPASTFSSGAFSRIVNEGAGRWALAWMAGESLNSVCSVDNAQSWGELRTTPTGGTTRRGYPPVDIASDRSGNVEAVWNAGQDYFSDMDVMSFLISSPPDPKADLMVGVTAADVSVVGVGQEFNYYVVVNNNGPDAAQDVVVKDTVSGPQSIVSVQTPQGTATETSYAAYVDLGSLDPYTSTVITVRAKALELGWLSNFAQVASSTEDPCPFNNNVFNFVAAVQVRPAVDLQMSMTALSNCVTIGEKLTFLITLKNNGPSPVGSLQVNDFLPPGVTFAEASAAKGQIGGMNQSVGWYVDNLDVGESTTATVSVFGVGLGTFTNTVSARPNYEVDTNPVNDSASVEFSVESNTGIDLTGSWASLAQSSRTSRRGTSYQLRGSFEVKNQGNVSSQASAVAFYLSDDAVLDGSDTLLKQVNVGKLRAGQTTRRNVQLRLSESASGKYVLGVIDPQGSVDETCEKNNTVVGGPVQ